MNIISERQRCVQMKLLDFRFQSESISILFILYRYLVTVIFKQLQVKSSSLSVSFDHQWNDSLSPAFTCSSALGEYWLQTLIFMYLFHHLSLNSTSCPCLQTSSPKQSQRILLVQFKTVWSRQIHLMINLSQF